MNKDNYPEADGDFSKAPNFKFNDDKVKFDTKYVDNANDNYGSSSGFLPKSLFQDTSAERRLYHLLVSDRIHPPSILPITTTFVCLCPAGMKSLTNFPYSLSLDSCVLTESVSADFSCPNFSR